MEYRDIKDIIIKFRDDRDWKQFHTPENLAKSISIEANELLECFQWNDNYDLEHVKEELADVFAYCVNMADVLDVDLLEIVKDKFKKNEIKYPIDKSKGKSNKYNDLG